MLGVTLALGLSAPLLAHDIPRDVTVQAFAKPEGKRLQLLVRVPLKSISDIEYPRREGDFVDLSRIDEALQNAARLYVANQIDVYENGEALPPPAIVSTRISVESDRSFATYEDALAHVTGPPLSARETLLWEQGLLDALFEYPIESAGSDFSIDARLDRLGQRVLTVLRFMPPGGVTRAYELEGNAGLVHLDPRWHQAALRFVVAGFFHILSGIDHLLFLFCLVIPFRRVRTLVPIVSAFTVAHSITLIASAYNYAPDGLWFPPLVETLIAASIVYMALENIIVSDVARLDRRWVVAFGFGLVHGFGFSFGLQQTLQFAGSHLLTSLLGFNVGVEIGQLMVLCALVPAIGLLFRFAIPERTGVIVLSVIVAHTGWHWMADRFDVLRQFPWPPVTAAGLATLIRWLIVVLLLVAVYASRNFGWRSGANPVPDPEPERSVS